MEFEVWSATWVQVRISGIDVILDASVTEVGSFLGDRGQRRREARGGVQGGQCPLVAAVCRRFPCTAALEFMAAHAGESDCPLGHG